MKRIRITGLCLIAALAVSAVAAASASATAPEVGRCVKSTPKAGGYSSANCTKTDIEDNDGAYEWRPGVGGKGKFTSSGGVGILTTVGGSAVECATESSAGEYKPGGNNKEEAGVFVTFRGCKSAGLSCTSKGAKAGELVTNELEGIVGWQSKALKKTDLELFPAKSVTSGLFIEFECVGLLVKVKGHVLVPIKNDAMKETEILKFVATKGKQKPEKWEESPEKAILEAAFSNFKGGAFEQAGQQITSTIKGEEKLELNAVL
jgi:hypothetical protein